VVLLLSFVELPEAFLQDITDTRTPRVTITKLKSKKRRSEEAKK
jgi:hypothetical protein